MYKSKDALTLLNRRSDHNQPRRPRLLLSVKQKIIVSFIALSLIFFGYLTVNLYAFSYLNSETALTQQITLPINEINTELLNLNITLINLVNEAARATQFEALKQIKSQLLALKQETDITTDRIQQLADQVSHQHLLQISKTLSADFKAALATGEGIITVKKRLNQSEGLIINALQQVNQASSLIKENIIFLDEEADSDISFQSYGIIASTEVIEQRYNQLFFQSEAAQIDQQAATIRENSQILTDRVTELLDLDEFDSEEWDLVYESFELLASQTSSPEGLLSALIARDQLRNQLDAELDKSAQISAQLSTALEQTSDISESYLNDSHQSIQSLLSRNQRLTLIVSLLTVAALLTIGAWLNHSIRTPLLGLQQGVDRIKEGVLTQSLRLSSGDEFEKTSENLESFRTLMIVVISGIKRVSDTLTEQAKTIVERKTKMSGLLKEQIESIALVSNKVTQFEQNSEEMQTRVDATNQQIASVLKISAETSDNALHSIELIGELKQHLNGSIDSANTLSNAIQDIYQVTALIDGIAEQINLLALNAAIEAARAGEHGRGFAVVADEVRKLSASTQQSTLQIHDQIKTIVNLSQQSKSQVESSFEIAEETLNRFQQSGEAMQVVESDISSISKEVNLIEAMAEQQHQEAQSGVNQLVAIQGISQQNSEQSEALAKSVNDLRELSKALQQSVSFFKVN